MKEVHFSRAVKEVQFGAWVFDLKRQVIFDNDVEKELEPLLFKLLSYLIINKGEILTRDDLSSDVWGQNYVDDNAINRAISELRKLLKSEQQKGIVIKTHHRKGYSFFLEPKIIYEDEQHVAPEIYVNKPQTNTINKKVVNKKNKKVKLSLIFSVFMMFVVGSAYFINNNKNIPVIIVDHEETVLSWLSGRYTYLVTSPNKKMVMFSFAPENNKKKQLVVKNLQTGEEKKLVSNTVDYTPIGWAYDSKSLFYQIKTDSKCEVWKINSDFERDNKKLFLCSDNIYNGFSIGEENFIYAKPGYRGKKTLYALTNRNLKTGEEFQITSPNLNSSEGDELLYYDSFLKLIFFQRSHYNYRELYMTDIDGGQQKKLINIDGRISSLIYNKFTNSLTWFNTQNNQLTEFSLDSNKIVQTKKIPKDYITYSFVSLISNDELLATSYPYSQNIYSYDFKRLSPIIERNNIDINGIFVNDKVYFISPYLGQKTINYRDQKNNKIKTLNFPLADYNTIQYNEFSDTLLLVYTHKIELYNKKLELIDTINTFSNIIYVSELDKGNIGVVTLDENKITSKVLVYSMKNKEKSILPFKKIKKFEQLNANTYVLLNDVNELLLFDLNTGKEKKLIKLENSKHSIEDSSHIIAINDNTLFYSDGFNIYTIDEENKWQTIYQGKKGQYIMNITSSEQHNKLVLSMYERKENQLLKLTF